MHSQWRNSIETICGPCLVQPKTCTHFAHFLCDTVPLEGQCHEFFLLGILNKILLFFFKYGLDIAGDIRAYCACAYLPKRRRGRWSTWVGPGGPESRSAAGGRPWPHPPPARSSHDLQKSDSVSSFNEFRNSVNCISAMGICSVFTEK